MSILCATNFSPEAIAATTAAAELARARGEDLWLAFVMPQVTVRAFGEAVVVTAEATLKGEAARAARVGATVTPVLLTGKLHQELPKFAADHKVSLVIAGETQKPPTSTGTGTLARMAQHLEAPLGVVRDAEKLISWAKGAPLKVMLALDRSRSSAVAAQWLASLRKFGRLEVLGAHVFWVPAEQRRLGLALGKTWDDAGLELPAVLERELRAALPPGLVDRMIIEPAFGRTSDHLNALAAKEKVDLLVLGCHRRQALGQLFSASEQCLQLAPVSVLTIPDAGAAPGAPQPVPRVERVLIATDFSANGARAVTHGLALLGHGEDAELLTVVPRTPTAEEAKVLIERLLKTVPDEARARGVRVSCQVAVGADPAEQIVAAAERLGSQVICVGSRGHTGLRKALLGSVAQRVLASTSRPVLVINPGEPA